MALDKAIAPRRNGERGREWRKPYAGAKAVDRTCRNNQYPPCPCCYIARMRKTIIALEESDRALYEYLAEE